MADAPPCRVLVIDDDVGKRYTLVRSLTAAGFAVTEATTGEAGLALITPDTDVVVLDIRLPDLDGYEVCRRIKSDRATVAVMVLELSAAYVKPADRVRGLEAGADAYLVHPIEPAELIAVVSALHRLRQTERQRQKLATQRDLLLGALGHDLRSPLQVIRLAAEILKSSADGLAPRQSRAVDQINGGVDRMQRMIEDLLFFAHSEVEGIPVTRQPTHLGDLVRDVVRDNQARAPDRAIEIDNAVDRPVSLDPDRFHQVLDNLIGNAIRHGEGPVTVTLSLDGTGAVIGVHNRGAPIPADAVPRLFDAFRQVHGKKGGVGLGLYIVDRIVAAHGGSIGVVSTEVDGTTFRIALPDA